MINKSKIDKLIEEFSLDNLDDLLFDANLQQDRKDFSFYNTDKLFGDISSLGIIETSDNKKVIVIATNVKKDLSERTSRKKQYDLSKKILTSSNSNSAGIFVFYDDSGNFRFSLVYADYSGTKKSWSTFRRFTFFVSNDEKITNKTFIDQITKSDFSTLSKIKEVFSVEKVTKEFFKKYRDLFIEFLEDFENNEEFLNVVVKPKITTTADFVKKLMGQIVFLYFVQKKGWLGVRPNENWGTGNPKFLRDLFTICSKASKNYFNDYLEPLFYKALAEKNKDDYFEEFNCKIPFLNGGLFESVYDWQNTEIKISNEIIGKLLDFFDQYNFTIDENTPSDQEISVDPEMLGKIFENLLEVKDRKDKGAFYTPREIVHYMCRESLIQHLVSDTSVPEERIRKLFEVKDTDLSVVVENEKKTQNIKELKEIAEKVDLSLRNIKIVDPAVGSGAFPMGMLNEISTTRYYLNSNFLNKKNSSEKELSLYDIKKETLENCIYAVDIEPGAVEIAKLRFWLALIVEYESNDLNIAPPTLPNLDYRIMQGNSLLEEYEGVKLFDENIIKIIDTSKEKQIEEFKKRQSVIQKEYFALNSKNELTPIKKSELDEEAKKISDQLKKLNKIEKNGIESIGLFDSSIHKESKLKADELKSLQKQFFETNNRERKIKIRENIEELEWKLIEATLKEQGKIEELEKIQKFKKEKMKPFFLWKLHFAEVFEEKGGFDVVIGNPPYVQIQKFKGQSVQKSYSQAGYEVYDPNSDLYCLFYEKGLNVLKTDKGILCYITSNKWLRAGYGKKLRSVFLRYNPKVLIDLGPGIFEGAAVDTNILLIQKEFTNKNDILALKLTKYNQSDIQSAILTKGVRLENLSEESWFIKSKLEQGLKLKLEKRGTALKLWDIQINKGIMTGFNEAYYINKDLYKLFISKYPDIFLYIKPLFRGRVIEKYYTHQNYDSYVISINDDFKIENYPLVFSHLKKYKDQLEKRAQFVRGDHSWYAIDNCPSKKLLERFNNLKIIYPNMTSHPSFSLDETGSVSNDKTFILTADNNIKYLCGIFNSKCIEFYLRNICSSLGEDGLELRKIFIQGLAIPEVKDADLLEINEIEKIVDDIVKTKKEYRDVDTRNLETQIDQLVYKLYDLTPEEIEIVENSSKK